ncbi:hypothetical protein A5893_09380 [Pedobacter psychrophilus]|uniref:Dipeptidylpeptidase IV N-terminal domain-containing protein n=2 Tax=Pedobacter psychrophilus TaxID=1826909 RepID=A0A179DFP1_9SPHI|nr:hypothetical protein A5893_09380 [Pedobacter psychrophilus]
MSTGNVIHRFFDTSPISPSGKYLALFRFPYNDHSPEPGDNGEVILVNIKTGNEKVIAKTKGWEFQLGANVQWGASDKELYFNDVDTSTWKGFAVKMNPFTRETIRMASTVFMVSPNGKKLATYNLEKSIFAQVGYGVIIPKEINKKNIGLVDDDGIIITDIATNTSKLVASVKQIYENTKPSIKVENPDNYEYYCFQVKWNPQGTRLLTTIQWTPSGTYNRNRAVITMLPDGSDIRTAISSEQWSKGGHHVNWAADGEHLTMNLNVNDKSGLEIISVKYDGTDLKTIYSPGSGHPSSNPKKSNYIITDAYAGEMPTKAGFAPIRLINLANQTETTIAGADLPEIKNFEFRVDAHPAWDKTGRYVVFNGTYNGTRSVYMADLKKLLKAK